MPSGSQVGDDVDVGATVGGWRLLFTLSKAAASSKLPLWEGGNGTKNGELLAKSK
jgi:hypothetical protein